jgi:hypothetical protein
MADRSSKSQDARLLGIPLVVSLVEPCELGVSAVNPNSCCQIPAKSLNCQQFLPTQTPHRLARLSPRMA